jgi:hypothetical protein
MNQSGQPVVQQEVPPKAEDKGFLGKIGDAFSSFLPGGEPDYDELQKKYNEASATAKDANAKAKEAADALAAAEAKKSIPTNTDAMADSGGRRRSRKQAGGRRRRTRRGKRSGCKRCGLKRCGCSKKRRTRR